MKTTSPTSRIACRKTIPASSRENRRWRSLSRKKTGLLTGRQKIREEIQQEILGELPKGAGGAIDPEEWFKNYRKVFEKAFEENEKELKAELEEVKVEHEDLDRYSF